MHIVGAADSQVRTDVYSNLRAAGLHTWSSFFDAAFGYDFVMSSILALSATHIAWMTNSVETKNLAYFHRGVALKGLQGAIGNFSRDNSDAVLAASILLSWQVSDW